jgi:hypothetical protein
MKVQIMVEVDEDTRAVRCTGDQVLSPAAVGEILVDAARQVNDEHIVMNRESGGKTYAPFTVEQVNHLNGFQGDGWIHPFTCPNEHPDKSDLVATTAGWVCPVEGCDYTQDWAHTHMTSWIPVDER